MKPSEKLIARLKVEGHISTEGDFSFHRTYDGRWQRSDGAWSWEVRSDGESVGSQFSVRECFKAKVWT